VAIGAALDPGAGRRGSSACIAVAKVAQRFNEPPRPVAVRAPLCKCGRICTDLEGHTLLSRPLPESLVEGPTFDADSLDQAPIGSRARSSTELGGVARPAAGYRAHRRPAPSRADPFCRTCFATGTASRSTSVSSARSTRRRRGERGQAVRYGTRRSRSPVASRFSRGLQACPASTSFYGW